LTSDSWRAAASDTKVIISWLFFRVARSTRMNPDMGASLHYSQSGSDRLEKQPTDLRWRHHYIRDGALNGPYGSCCDRYQARGQLRSGSAYLGESQSGTRKTKPRLHESLHPRGRVCDYHGYERGHPGKLLPTNELRAEPEDFGSSGWSVSSPVGFSFLSHWRFTAFHGTLILAG
jgi:hypothetical protein